jgi:hypothetical protein
MGKCVNSTSNNFNCKSTSDINKILDNILFNIAFTDYEIDHKNYNQPVKHRMRGLSLKISSSVYKRYNIFMKSIDYNTDSGLLFEENDIQQFYMFDRKDLDVDLKTGSTFSPYHFSQFSFMTENKKHIYYRSYMKIQAAIANLSGFIKIMFITTKILTYFQTRKIFFLKMMNTLSIININETIDDHNSIYMSKLNLNIGMNR